ncbi:unnamed protein product [Chrysoparadoxa australica]
MLQEMMVMNVMMPTAVSVWHRKHGKQEDAGPSLATLANARALVEAGTSPGLWDQIAACLDELQQSEKEAGGNWLSFVDRMNYSQEQREGIIRELAALVHPHVLLESKSYHVLLRLNRPRQLNALSHAALRTLTEQLTQAERSRKFPLITGSGNRAFCSGGDIKQVAKRVEDGNLQAAQQYLLDEYKCDLLVHRSTHAVAVANGLVMGGGAGIFMGCSYRVVTEKASFAMPECAIGIIPDAGATYFLGSGNSQISAAFGMYCALTGARVPAEAMLSLGLATHIVPSKAVDQLVAELAQCPTSDILTHIEEYAVVPETKAGSGPEPDVSSIIDEVEKLSSNLGSLEELHGKLAHLSEECGGEWATEALEQMKKGSPISQVLTHAAMTLAMQPNRTIDQALGCEYAAVSRCFSLDFVEGVSCVVGAKKGNLPQWQHSSWDEARGDTRVQEVLKAMQEASPLSALCSLDTPRQALLT